MRMRQPIVSIKNFHLVIGEKEIVKNLSFEVRSGEVFALLGANGSGKTSTIRSLLGIYQPTSGTLHIDGKPYTPAQARLVGYLPEDRGLYVRATVLDAMTYFGELKGLSRDEAQQFSLDYLKRVDLDDKASVKIKKLASNKKFSLASRSSAPRSC